MCDAQSRRDFLKAAILAGTAVPATGVMSARRTTAADVRSPSERLNLAVIGVAGRGAANLAAVSSENIVALCDIDAQRLAQASAQYPHASKCDDFRTLFARDDLDGIVVSTPDHTHAIAISMALRKGLAVYCEKPLVHSIYEARYIGSLAADAECVTQMGNQIHNDPSGNYRRAVEIVKAGTLGLVRRVHVWMAGVGHFQVGRRVAEAQVPEGISYDLWIGPAPYRPFHPSHFHFNWRYWWDFGGGQLADFWCHFCDLAYWALDLGYPTAVHATGSKGHDGDNECPRSMQVDYWFPARSDLPPVHLTWYHGGPMPPGAEAYQKDAAVLFEGEHGRLLADYTTRKVFLDDGREPPVVPPTIPDSSGHHQEWIEAIKRHDINTTCNFRYGALLVEAGLLGNVSYRAGQKKIEWDAKEGRATNCPEAERFIRRPYRQGWRLA